MGVTERWEERLAKKQQGLVQGPGGAWVRPPVEGAFWDGQGWDMPVKDGGGLSGFFSDFEDDFKKGHTLGQFVQNNTGSEGLATLLDPAYNDVQDNMEPVAFGAPGKDNPITGVEGGGVFDDPYISTLVNLFTPGYVGAIAGLANNVVDYENAKKQGANVSYGDTVGRSAAGAVASTYLNSGDTYGYGNTNLGRAGTAATTSGLVSAAQGADEEQIARNAAISGLSSYAGSTARDMYTDSTGGGPVEPSRYNTANKLGGLTSSATNFGLRSLWKDPSAASSSDDYQDIINTLAGFRNQLNNRNTGNLKIEDLQGIENTPEGQQLLSLFSEQDQPASSRSSKAGGSGQYGMGSDQVEQDAMREDGYLV